MWCAMSTKTRSGFGHAGTTGDFEAVGDLLVKVLKVFALMMVASAGASAQTTLAVTVQAGFPYYASPQDVFSKPPLGQFGFNMHLCEKKEMPILDHVQFLQFILPSGESVYSEYRFQGAITHDPAGDKRCESNAARSATHGKSMAASGQASAQTATPSHVTPSTASSGTASTATGVAPDSALDAAMRADVAEAFQFYKDMISPNIFGGKFSKVYQKQIEEGYRVLLSDPTAKNIATKVAVGRFYNGRNAAKARRWFQMMVDQIRANPEVPLPANVTKESIEFTLRSIDAQLPAELAAERQRIAAERQRNEAVAEDDRKKAQKAAAIRAAEAAPADTTRRVVLRWKPDDKTDPLSGKVTPQVCAGCSERNREYDATGETIQAYAFCDDEQPPHTIYNIGSWGDNIVQDISGSGTGREPQIEDIEFHVFIGNSNKGASLLWTGKSVDIEYQVGIEPTQTTSADQGRYNDVVTLNAVTLRSDYSVMSVARNIGVELPLANGNKPVVEINPNDPVLRAFTETCEKQYQAHLPPK